MRLMTTTGSLNEAATRAVQWLRGADGLLISAGAGMGVDSGLPDFRGTEGFWRAYPALQAEGVCFEEIANPAAFRQDPARAWGFYGPRLNLYRRTVPHDGYRILRKWADRMERGTFVFTSNVDGHFQKAGSTEAQVAECHGSIHWLQCAEACRAHLWSADEVHAEVDEVHCRLLSPLPACPHCAAMARPNILTFGDGAWIETRTGRQMRRLRNWLSIVWKLTLVELGAGRAIPTVRRFSERCSPRVVGINPREFAIDPSRGIGIAGNALDVFCMLVGMLD